MNNKIISQLQELNFSPNESKVYSALLEVGQTSAGEIIRQTQLHRSVVYETLDKLITRKLVFKLEKNKIAYFQATDPSRILQNIENQKNIAQSLLPLLKKSIDQSLPEITIYEGVESYRRFWLDIVKKLPKGSTDYIAGSIGQQWYEIMGNDYKKYHEIRSKRKIKWKMIIFKKEDFETEALKKFPKLNEFRWINRKFEREGNFNVLENNSVILNSIHEPLIIEIKNQTLVRVFKNLFDLLWAMGRKIK
jgi:HTH-type transcriptional regulator, sugar sensing transcriptional regulator